MKEVCQHVGPEGQCCDTGVETVFLSPDQPVLLCRKHADLLVAELGDACVGVITYSD